MSNVANKSKSPEAGKGVHIRPKTNTAGAASRTSPKPSRLIEPRLSANTTNC